MMKTLVALSLFSGLALAPLSAQTLDVKGALLKRLHTSEEFTLKVADAMPASDYSYKMTPDQMSFGHQLTHLAQAMSYFMSAFTGAKPNPGNKPATEDKADVIAFVKSSYEKTISEVSQLTNEQLAKEYKGGEGSSTGLEMLMAMMSHTDHHRACAEMYMRAKGVTPPKYMD